MNLEDKIRRLPELESTVQNFLKTGSEEAKQQMIEVGQVMIDYYTAVYSTDDIDQDLHRAAKAGFLMALKQYNFDGSMSFSAYAANCMISEIRTVLAERKLFISPEWLGVLKEKVEDIAEKLEGENNNLPTLEKIAQKINTAEKVMTGFREELKDHPHTADSGTADDLFREKVKTPLEDIKKIRKSLDRINDIKKKVLNLMALNLEELHMAIREEDIFLAREQEKYQRLVENSESNFKDYDRADSFKLGFPEEYSENELKRYFEVLADEYGLHLIAMRIKGELKNEDALYASVPLEIDLDGRYRGLLHLLDYMRNEEKAIHIERVRTTRNLKIPARNNIFIALNALFRRES